MSIRSTPSNWTVDDPIFVLLHLFFAKNYLFLALFLQFIVLILHKIILYVRNNFY